MELWEVVDGNKTSDNKGQRMAAAEAVGKVTVQNAWETTLGQMPNLLWSK